MKKTIKLSLLAASISLSAFANATTDRNYQYRWVDLNDDPLVKHQWNLLNTGQKAGSVQGGTAGYDLNLWQTHIWGHKGQDIKVAVIDSGTDLTHPDLIDNLVENQNPALAGPWQDPTRNGFNHGTSVAGIIAAAQNSIGVRGVSPKAKLVAFQYLGNNASLPGFWEYTHGLHPETSDIRVFNQSYGRSPIFSDSYNDAAEKDMKTVSLKTNSDQRTALFVKSAGNSFQTPFYNNYRHLFNYDNFGLPYYNSNIAAANANYYNIVVSALDAHGKRASYSTVGSSVFLSAPGGEFGYENPAHVTTQVSCKWHEENFPEYVKDGCDNAKLTNTLGDLDYTQHMNGTSSAAPNVSGAIALLMSAAEQQKHNLTARDIRHLLAKTATVVDKSQPNYDVTYTTSSGQERTVTGLEGWSVNAANVAYSPTYGFGLVDVDKAVELIRRYAVVDLPSELLETPWYGLEQPLINMPIADAGDSATTVSHTISDDLYVEAVQVRLNVKHTRIPDLLVELESPSGTRSVLMSPYNGLNGYRDYKFLAPEVFADFKEFFDNNGFRDHLMLSHKFYGEKANAGDGEWKLHVTDVTNQYQTGATVFQNQGRYVESENNIEEGTLQSWSIRVIGHERKVTKKKSL